MFCMVAIGSHFICHILACVGGVCEKTSSDFLVPVVAGSAAALVVIVIVIVVIIVCRRKKRPQSTDNQKFVKPSLIAVGASSKKQAKASQDNNVYVNVAIDPEEDRKEVKACAVTKRLKSSTATDDADQSEEMLDEDEAPSSTPYYNIDEDDVIREVAVQDLAATVQRIKQREGGFAAEYGRLPTGFTATYADSQKPENAGKNKFRGYYPYDHNRVRLSLLPNIPGSDYINASIMHNFNETKTYIASQAPNKKTVRDFWRMIWEQRCGRVVMLTGLAEDNKVKCYQYWPETDLLTTDHFLVTLEDTDVRANYTIRTMNVKNIETGENRTVVHYHYTTWPDHGVPDILALAHFIWMIRRTDRLGDGPLLVHCSAGIGRTGTYIAVDSMLDQAREEGKVDVLGYVTTMRGQRKNMIQTKEQYECVFHCLVEMTRYGNTSLAVNVFTTVYSNSGLDGRVDGRVDGKTFKELTKVLLCEEKTGAPVKNQMWVNGNQNFHIRTGPSLRSVTGHMLCVSPSPSLEKLLWKLVEENNVTNIIVISHKQANLVAEKGSSKTFKNMTLTTTNQTSLASDLSLSTILLKMQESGCSVELKMLSFNVPVSAETLSVSLLEHTHLQQMIRELSPRVLVHSEGDLKPVVLFCILGNILSEIQEDERVDILHHVKTFSRCFQDLVFTQNDVKMLFDFALKCVEMKASTYANM